MAAFLPYIARPIRYLGLAEPRGFRIKQYAIQYGSGEYRIDDFARGLHLAFDSLPHPAATAVRPGVGFAIAHQGNGADYCVLGWWDNENELPLHIFVRSQKPDAPWRPAQGSESVCVWDLEVIGYERKVYIETLLGGGTPEDYLARHMG